MILKVNISIGICPTYCKTTSCLPPVKCGYNSWSSNILMQWVIRFTMMKCKVSLSNTERMLHCDNTSFDKHQHHTPHIINTCCHAQNTYWKPTSELSKWSLVLLKVRYTNHFDLCMKKDILCFSFTVYFYTIRMWHIIGNNWKNLDQFGPLLHDQSM